MSSIFAALPSEVVAQTNSGNPSRPVPEAAASTPTIDPVLLVMLARSAVIAVQHANATGNYSVLRDMGTPVFRDRFDQAKLTQIFAKLRERGLNLSPALVLQPKWIRQPEITRQGQLHLAGIFPTQPLEIQFEVFLVQVDGAWRLDGIAVDAAAPSAPSTAAAAKTTAPAKEKALKTGASKPR